jgi:hypothetical protein
MASAVYEVGASPLRILVPNQNEREISAGLILLKNYSVVPWRNLALAGICMTAYISAIGASSPLLRSCEEMPSPIATSLRDRGALNLFAVNSPKQRSA